MCVTPDHFYGTVQNIEKVPNGSAEAFCVNLGEVSLYLPQAASEILPQEGDEILIVFDIREGVHRVTIWKGGRHREEFSVGHQQVIEHE